MSNKTTKPLSTDDFGQTLKHAYNEVDASITINGFLVGKVGHKVTLDTDTTTNPDDTEIYSFYDNNTLLYQLTLIYTDNSHNQLISAERTA